MDENSENNTQLTPLKGKSPRYYVWQQFKRNKPALISLWLLIVLVFVAIFADFLANSQPLYVKYHGKTFYPAVSTLFNPSKVDSVKHTRTGKTEIIQFDIAQWKQMHAETIVWTPIPYSPGEPDPFNRNYANPLGKQKFKTPEGDIVPIPGRFRHILGTDKIGRDVAAGLIHGTRISLTVGIIAMGIAALIGIFLGALAGYFGDRRMSIPRGRFLLIILGVILGYFYAFSVREHAINEALDTSIGAGLWAFFVSIVIFGIIVWLFNWLGKILSQIKGFRKMVFVPVDGFILRVMEILRAIPTLILLITVSAIFEDKSLFLLMAIIGLISWTGIARFTRAEFFRTRSLDYIEGAKALGFSERRIIFHHALPNSIAPVFVAVAFGVGTAILIESSLSFLGIGVPDDVVTWGSLLSAGQQRFTAWWLVVFPGIAIFLTVTIFNLIGDALRDATDPKLRD